MLGAYQFKVGQRVKPSQRAWDGTLFWRYRSQRSTFRGTVTKVDEFNCPTVLWDGRKTSSSYHPNFIDPVRK